MVILFLGSKSDLPWGKEIIKHLSEFSISYKLHIASAHKTPQYLLKLLEKYEKSGNSKVYICVAGRSNALGGFVDAQTKNPVINCPPYSEKYKGLDVLSSLRMPSGIASMTVIEPEQAALAAAKILGERKKVSDYQEKMRKKIIGDDVELKRLK